MNARQCAFEQTSKLLYDAFPKEHTGQRFTGRWHDCGLYIQHAIVLNSHYLRNDPTSNGYSVPPEFAKLMAWCSWYNTISFIPDFANQKLRYLFEIADYTNFTLVLDGGMKACGKPGSEAFDEATWSLLNYNAGTVETSVGSFEKARKSLYAALEVRRSLGNKDDIAATLNNLGLLHNSVHEFDRAEEHYSEAREIHRARPESDDRNLSLKMVEHNLQRNAIQNDKDVTIGELQATVDFFNNTISWWMTGQ